MFKKKHQHEWNFVGRHFTPPLKEKIVLAAIDSNRLYLGSGVFSGETRLYFECPCGEIRSDTIVGRLPKTKNESKNL